MAGGLPTNEGHAGAGRFPLILAAQVIGRGGTNMPLLIFGIVS